MSPNGWLCVPFQKCGSGRELRFVTFCSSIIVTHSLSFMHGSKKPTEHPPPCRASRCLLYWAQSVTPLSKICLTIKMYHRYFSRQVRNHHFCFFCLAALPQTLYPHFHEIMDRQENPHNQRCRGAELYLGGLQHAEHERDARGEKPGAVVLRPDRGELCEEGNDDIVPTQLLGSEQRL